MLDASTGTFSKKIRIVLVGDKKVGKTSLVHAFKNGEFVSDPVEELEAKKNFVVGSQQYLFVMIELHDNWEKVREHLHGVEFVLLCYDGEAQQEERLATKWTPKISDWFPKAKMYLVRTKCDRLYDNFDVSEDGHSPVDVAMQLHAAKAFECSAKDYVSGISKCAHSQTGIEAIFAELALAHDAAHPEYKVRPPLHEDFAQPSLTKVPTVSDSQLKQAPPAPCAALQYANASIPVIKYVGSTIKELAWNPECLPGVKEKINAYVPFLFYTRPAADSRPQAAGKNATNDKDDDDKERPAKNKEPNTDSVRHFLQQHQHSRQTLPGLNRTHFQRSSGSVSPISPSTKSSSQK